MTFMSWKPAYCINVKQLDDQHSMLLGMINELHDAMKDGTAAEVLGSILDKLISYTSSHFTAEEELMAAYSFPEEAAHKEEHQILIRQVLDLQEKFKTGKIILTLDVLMFLRDWLMDHIHIVDKRLGAFLNSKNIC